MNNFEKNQENCNVVFLKNIYYKMSKFLRWIEIIKHSDKAR